MNNTSPYSKLSISFKDYSSSKMKTVNTDWKKIISDNLLQRVKQSHIYRMDSFLFNKSLLIDSMKEEFSLKDDEELILSEYYDKFLQLLQSDITDTTDSNTFYASSYSPQSSICPFCFYPVILLHEKVCCFNQCFTIEVPPQAFSDHFTLDNLMDMLLTHKKQHKCTDKPTLVMIDTQVLLICPKCWSN